MLGGFPPGDPRGPARLATAGRRRPVGAVGAVGVLARIRTEQRRLERLVEDLEPRETPERVLTLLEDAQLSLREAGEHLHRVTSRRELPCAEWDSCPNLEHSHRLEHMPGRDLP